MPAIELGDWRYLALGLLGLAIIARGRAVDSIVFILALQLLMGMQLSRAVSREVQYAVVAAAVAIGQAAGGWY
jgi:hypothetical protein